MTINGDEGEPGTFKDRYHLERDPHRMFEGALIAAHAVEAERIYLYMRDEYPGRAARSCAPRSPRWRRRGLIEPGFIELRRGAGAYICGEESAMLESIEGKRGLPRHRPPFIAEVGLFGRPTLNHNVETLWWIRDIVENGTEWFAAQGRRAIRACAPGRSRAACASRASSWRPAGITVRELIDELLRRHGRGPRPSRPICPAAPQAASCPPRWRHSARFRRRARRHGAFVGSHAVVIFSDKDDIREATLNLLRFFEHESCGQCTPCRAGTGKLVSLLEPGGRSTKRRSAIWRPSCVTPRSAASARRRPIP